MPYYQRLDTGETAWRPPLTPARAAGAVRIADPDDPAAASADSSTEGATGGGRRYLVGLFFPIPLRMLAGRGAAAASAKFTRSDAEGGAESAAPLPGQVLGSVRSGLAPGAPRFYVEARKGGGGGGGGGLGGSSGVWVEQEAPAAISNMPASGRGGSSGGGGGGRARIPYGGGDGQVPIWGRMGSTGSGTAARRASGLFASQHPSIICLRGWFGK